VEQIVGDFVRYREPLPYPRVRRVVPNPGAVSLHHQAFDLLLDRGGIAFMPECMYVGAPADLDCSRIAGLEDIHLVLTYRRAADRRTERIVREVARSLRTVGEEKAG
jgi:hypothetical protein